MSAGARDARLWLTAGVGDGDLEIDDDAGVHRSALELRSIGAGGSGVLRRAGGTVFRLKGEAVHTRLRVLGSDDDDQELRAMEVSAQRLRLGLESRHPRTLADGARLEPRLEVGIRHDGGDGETGDALELGAALRHHNPGSGLSAEASAYALVGRDDYAEWGVQLRLSPGYGAQRTATGRIWQQDLNLNADDADRDHAPRLDAELGYTLSTPALRGLLTPYSEMTMGGDNRTYRLGLRWAVDRLLDLNLTGERNQTGDNPAEHSILLRGEVRF